MCEMKIRSTYRSDSLGTAQSGGPGSNLLKANGAGCRLENRAGAIAVPPRVVPAPTAKSHAQASSKRCQLAESSTSQFLVKDQRVPVAAYNLWQLYDEILNSIGEPSPRR